MTKILLYIAILLLAYLMGCSNMALYLSKYKGVDLRAAIRPKLVKQLSKRPVQSDSF